MLMLAEIVENISRYKYMGKCFYYYITKLLDWYAVVTYMYTSK